MMTDLSKQTVKELRAIVKEHKLTGYSRMTKIQLIDAIEMHLGILPELTFELPGSTSEVGEVAPQDDAVVGETIAEPIEDVTPEALAHLRRVTPSKMTPPEPTAGQKILAAIEEATNNVWQSNDSQWYQTSPGVIPLDLLGGPPPAPSSSGVASGPEVGNEAPSRCLSCGIRLFLASRHSDYCLFCDPTVGQSGSRKIRVKVGDEIHEIATTRELAQAVAENPQDFIPKPEPIETAREPNKVRYPDKLDAKGRLWVFSLSRWTYVPTKVTTDGAIEREWFDSLPMNDLDTAAKPEWVYQDIKGPRNE